MKYKKLAILAAAGDMPLLAIKRAIQKKIRFIVVGFKHISEFQKLKKFNNIPVFQTQIGYIRSILKILKKENVDSILLSGRVDKVNLFKVLRFDLTALGLSLKLKDFHDVSILQSVVDYFKKNNIPCLSQKEFFSDWAMKKGFITKKKCKKKDIENLKWGFQTAREIADMRIGQSIIIGKKVVLSVEAIEGTDKMITRARPNLLKHNYFIKVAQKGHNPAFDLPVFGLITLKLLNSCQVKIIGLEKDIVLIPEMEKVIEFADKNKIIIYGI